MVTRNITFNKNYSATGTLIEYKQEGGSWIAPSSPPNPTTLEYYPLEFDEGITYYVRVSSVGGACTKSSTIITVFIPDTACCPPGYTLSVDESYCYQINEVPATEPSGGVSTSVPVTYPQYTMYGATIYDPGFNLNGTGSNTRITPFSNTLWTNVPQDNSTGILNRTGMWAAGTPVNNQVVGFSTCITISETKTFYVGCGADNKVKINIDGNPVLDMNETTLTTYLYSMYSITNPANPAPYTFWHIYPITILAGTHILEVVGVNGVAPGANPASIGFEIYDMTKSELQAALTTGDLTTIFTTEDYRTGQPLQIASDDDGYTCPDGYSLDSCDFPYVCKQQLTTSTISC